MIYLLKNKDYNAFKYLYKNYSAVLYGVIRAIIKDEHTAEDTLQECFIKIWQKIHQYDDSRGRMYTWLYRIARNCAIDRLRINTPHSCHIEEVGNYHYTEINLDTLGLQKMVQSMELKFWTVLYLQYFKGYTCKQTALALGIPDGTVKTRTRKAVQKLRAIYDMDCKLEKQEIANHYETYHISGR